ncbi:MAG: hypothetical protein Q8S57_11235 [Methanoregula sp.]|nr:hypothetical protein [Methanoregula sp.]
MPLNCGEHAEDILGVRHPVTSLTAPVRPGLDVRPAIAGTLVEIIDVILEPERQADLGVPAGINAGAVPWLL